MTHFSQDKFLYLFAEKFIKTARDLIISQCYRDLENKSNHPFNTIFFENTKHLSPEDMSLIKIMVLNAVDGALDNFLWLMEQEDDFDLIAYQDNHKTYKSLRDSSDGLSVDYWNFVEEFSDYPTAQEMAGYDPTSTIDPYKIFSGEYLVQLFSEDPEQAKKYFVITLNNKEQYERLKNQLKTIPKKVINSLINVTLSRSSFHKIQCEELQEILGKREE